MENSLKNIGITVNYKDIDAYKKLGKILSDFLDNNTILVCIGTDKCIGDCIGPLVGSFLTKEKFPYPVFGTLDTPIHALNIKDSINNINSIYPKAFTIAIDACVGMEEDIGNIQIRFGPIYPGKGVGKKLPTVGSLSVVASVDTIDNTEFFSMGSIRLNFIMRLSEIIKDAFLYASNVKT